MEFLNKIWQYLIDNLHMYACICTFAIVTTALCTFICISINNVNRQFKR